MEAGGRLPAITLFLHGWSTSGRWVENTHGRIYSASLFAMEYFLPPKNLFHCICTFPGASFWVALPQVSSLCRPLCMSILLNTCLCLPLPLTLTFTVLVPPLSWKSHSPLLHCARDACLVPGNDASAIPREEEVPLACKPHLSPINISATHSHTSACLFKPPLLWKKYIKIPSKYQ